MSRGNELDRERRNKMKNWRTAKALYKIVEIRRNSIEEYSVVMTGDEVREYCRSHRDAYGYVAGIGGDRAYDCFAVLQEVQ